MPPADISAELETVRLLFDGQRLAQARQFSGLLKRDLAERVRITPAAIGQFENGMSKPSIATLGKLALALGVPVGFFAANRPRAEIREDQVHFRSLRSTSRRNRARARVQVELLSEILGLLERRVRLPAVDLPALQPDLSPEDAAMEVRAAWELGDGPIANVVGLLERKGVIVSRLPAATDEVDAFSCRIGERPFIVLATNKDAADRARFDAAHELAHLLLHEDAQPGDVEVERAAHRFAAEFLAPAASIRRELPNRLDWPKFAELKVRWGVSIAMLLRRARDLAFISDAAYRRAMMEMSRRGWRNVEPIDLGSPEQPELLGRAVGLLAANRGFTLQDLAGELALHPENLAPFADTLAADPREELAL
jgi:Zn-dependent peptidase ImmA (M78 family)/DNA-binding XRE family transcriptional regulator